MDLPATHATAEKAPMHQLVHCSVQGCRRDLTGTPMRRDEAAAHYGRHHPGITVIARVVHKRPAPQSDEEKKASFPGTEAPRPPLPRRRIDMKPFSPKQLNVLLRPP